MRPLSPHTLGSASGWRDKPYKSPAKAIDHIDQMCSISKYKENYLTCHLWQGKKRIEKKRKGKKKKKRKEKKKKRKEKKKKEKKKKRKEKKKEKKEKLKNRKERKEERKKKKKGISSVFIVT